MTETRNDLDAVRDTYDRVASRYADAFLDELADKPLDRALLDLFAADTRPGPVADLGTGSGQVARYLHDRGLGSVVGIDLSPEMVAESRLRHPAVAFQVDDFLQLSAPDDHYAGLTAFYAIVHLTRADLVPFFAEARRVLRPGASLLIAWHVGSETLAPETFLDAPCPIAWNFFPSDVVIAAATAAGLALTLRLERAPYPSEHASTRGYIMAQKPF
jgi:SAM-dependent methyltransferase